jgi:DNA-binding NarL/FixJ family response regulator
MIQVMIADDNLDLNSLCCNILSKDKDIQIISSTLDGESTLKDYMQLKPDVLLLDLDLPKMNGIDIINNICLDETEKKKNNIIIISGNTELRYNLFNTSKIFRIMPKPVDFNDVISTIKEIVTENNYIPIVEKEIRNFLFSLNFNLYADGTRYLIDAIKLGSENIRLVRNIKTLYDEVAELHSTSSNTIKWGIRNAIETMNHNTTKHEINKIFHINYDKKMTPKYFIPLVISYFDK